MSPFRGSLSGAAVARIVAASRPTSSRSPLHSSHLVRSTARSDATVSLTQRYALRQFIPFHPFLPVGMLLAVLPHRILTAVFAALMLLIPIPAGYG